MILSNEISLIILDLMLEKFIKLNLYPVIGAEVEFYLSPFENSRFEQFLQALLMNLDLLIEKEKGENQFEVRILHDIDIKNQINKITQLKTTIEDIAKEYSLIANFNPKPFETQPGSALHIHLNLINEKKENLFIKNENIESELLLQSIAGLCNTMEEMMIFFAPTEDAYLRYQVDHLHSPSKICWGGNNRSAAIRIPLDQKHNRRLEHRVAASNSSPIEVINAILYGILKGIENNLIPPDKLYGNAFLEQYNYPRITQRFVDAKKNYEKSSFKLMVDEYERF